MNPIPRKTFLGLGGLGALGAASPAFGSSHEPSEYEARTRPPIAIGIGKGQAASLSIVWLPAPGDEQLPARDVRLVIFGIDGKVLAEKKTTLAPFTGATVEYQPSMQEKKAREVVFNYTFIDKPLDDIFGVFEVYDVSSGGSVIAAPVGIA